MFKLPHIPLSPRARRIVSALILGLGVWFVGRQLSPVAPREVQIQLPLRDYREGPRRVHRVSVAFERGDEAVRALSQPYNGTVPATWTPTVSLAEGRYRAVVTLELSDQVLRRTSSVDVRAGEAVVLAPPTPP